MPGFHFGLLELATPLLSGIIYAVVTWRKGSRLRIIREDSAEGESREIFCQIREALGLPMLHLFYPALAAYPAFLKLHWEMVRPIATSCEFWTMAERLRADSYTRTHNYFRIPAVPEIESARQEIRAAIDFFHYQDPLLLLLMSLQAQALEGAVGERKRATPAGLPAMREKPRIVLEENAPPEVRRTYHDIRRTFDYPYVCSEFQALAPWPDILRACWRMLKQQLLDSPLYDESRYSLSATASSLASELPGPLELTLDQLADAGLPQDDLASIARILDLFVKTLSGSLINVSAVKVALEGGNLAATALKEEGEPQPHRGVA